MSTFLPVYNAGSINTCLSTATFIAGACDAQITHLEKALPNQLDENGKFMESLYNAVTTYDNQKSNIHKIQNQINQLQKEDSLKTPLLGQVKWLLQVSESFTSRLQKISERTLESKIKEAEEKEKKAYEILNYFRKEPTEANQLAIKESVKSFSNAVKQLHRFSVRYPFLLSEEKHKDLKRIDDMLALFKSLINTQNDENKISPLINRAIVLFHPSSGASKDEKAEWIDQFERQFNLFPKKLKDQFDRRIRDLSPELKRGKVWKKNQRYNDFNVFKQALAHILQKNFEADYAEMKIPYHIDTVYTLLHRLGLGPQEQDPIVWSKDNFPFVFDLIAYIEDEHLIQMEAEISSCKSK